MLEARSDVNVEMNCLKGLFGANLAIKLWISAIVIAKQWLLAEASRFNGNTSNYIHKHVTRVTQFWSYSLNKNSPVVGTWGKLITFREDRGHSETEWAS